MGVTLLVASSLSAAAVNLFLDRFALGDVFSGVWTRDNAGGIRAVPMQKAIQAASLSPEHVMALVDTTESLTLAKELGLNAMLMINEYEQGRRLAAQAPTGGIVSLHELPDAIRFVAEGARLRR
jgi:phosphoglycolate phosphatase-like HAD superfamily hydrolase